MRIVFGLAAATVLLTLAACGGSSSGTSTAAEPAATSTAVTTESGGAPCTKEALADGARPSFQTQDVEILDGFVCEGGWASGPVLVGPSGSEEQIEAAFLLKDENGTWKVPAKLPCDDSAVPEKVLDNSPCRVS